MDSILEKTVLTISHTLGIGMMETYLLIGAVLLFTVSGNYFTLVKKCFWVQCLHFENSVSIASYIEKPNTVNIFQYNFIS